MERRKDLTSILVKPAGPRCNLGCTYCYYLKKAELYDDHKLLRMNDDVLRHMVKQVMWSGARQVSFGWQGGEPTLMGLPFFERAIEYQVRFGQAGQSVGNGLQTNGILIDREWALFLRDARFLVGLSLDGPAHVHDRYRRFANGGPSWAYVVKARDALLNAGVEVNALVVVNDYSVQYAREIYEYHKSNGLSHMQFIPCVEPGADLRRAAAYSVDAASFGHFLCALFDLWSADFVDGLPTTSIRWFDSLFYTYVGLAAPECTLLPECGVYVVVEHKGDVYACDFFVEPKWRLGNLMQDNLHDLLNSARQNEFGRVKADLASECRRCQWLSHCYGGCPKDRAVDPADAGVSHFCRSYKTFFQHADAGLTALAEAWRQRQNKGG